MQFTQIRNATVRITFNSTTFLVDPWLAPMGSMGCFRDIPDFVPCHEEQLDIPMPMCELPWTHQQILEGVDFCIVTHLHPDHVDLGPAGQIGPFLPKDLPILVQNGEDAKVFGQSGFEDVRVLGDMELEGPLLVKTPGLHGTVRPCGPSCGVLFKAAGEKTLYLAGDTIWYEGVAKVLEAYKPEVIVLNACAAELQTYGRLIMDDADLARVAEAAPQAKLVASHLDTVAHAGITRASLRSRLAQRGLLERVLVPNDGKTLTF